MPNMKNRLCGQRPISTREALWKNAMESRDLPPDTAERALAFVRKAGSFQNNKLLGEAVGAGMRTVSQLIKKAGVIAE